MTQPVRSQHGEVSESDNGGRDRTGSLEWLSLSCLAPSPQQARRSFDERRLSRLGASISAVGVLEPVIVRPVADGRYEIVAGERRYRAAMEAGLEELPCTVRECSDLEALKLGLLENVQREDLSDLDKSDALRAYHEASGLTWEELAGEVGLSPSRMRQLAMLQRLAAPVKEAMRTGQVSCRVAAALLPLPEAAQVEVLEVALREKLSADAVRLLVAQRQSSGEEKHAARSMRRWSKASQRFLESAQIIGEAVDRLPEERRQELLDALRPLVAKLGVETSASEG